MNTDIAIISVLWAVVIVGSLIIRHIRKKYDD